MKNASLRWAWLALGFFAVVSVATWHRHDHAMLCWSWAACGLCVAWVALLALRLGLTQWLFVGAGLLNAAAGVSNGLVMALNGGLMPFEEIAMGSSPRFLDSESDLHGPVCRVLARIDDAALPREVDRDTHFKVPPPRIFHGAKKIAVSPPRLAALDDRQGIFICGRLQTYSKGDMMGFIGCVMLGMPGFLLLLLQGLWRILFRTRDAPTGR